MNLAQLKAMAAQATPLMEALAAQAKGSDEDKGFRVAVLARVRIQIKTVLDMMVEAAEDVAKMEKLSRSLDLLLGQEQKLAGRASPGVLKPSNRKSKSTPVSPFE